MQQLIRQVSQMPEISVIIPTYNRCERTRSCLESVLGQTFGNFEVMVVDDGSTDSTCDMIAASHDARIRYVRQDNAGPSAARNRALDLAQGDWVAFLDSDDTWEPEKLRVQMNLVEQTPEVGFVFCDCHWVEGNGARSATRFGRLPGLYSWPGRREGTFFVAGESVFLSLLAESPIHTSGTMIRKRLLQEDRFDRRLVPAEDWEFWLRISRKTRVAYVDQPLVIIHRHDGNISGAMLTRVRASYLALQVMLNEYVDLTDSEKAGILREIERSRHELIYQCLVEGDPAEARDHIAGAERMSVPLAYRVAACLPASVLRLVRRLRGVSTL